MSYMSYFDYHYYALNKFKKGQLDSNRQDILNALRILGNARPEQILKYLEKRNHEAALKLYENGIMTRAKMEKYCKERTMSKRTIHRHLRSLLKKGWIEHVGDSYSLADKVKDDVIYWSHEFGDSVLYTLMRSYYPQLLSFEQNIEELIKIFGIYVLYCLAKAAQPPVDENLKSDNLRDRDKLVVSWVNEVFHPQRMLDYFIASMSHVHSDDTVRRIWAKTFTKDQNMRLGSQEENKISDASKNHKHIRWVDENGHNFNPESAYGLYTQRWWQTFLPISKSSNTVANPFYILNEEIIRKITEVIGKKYSDYFKDMVQNTQNEDIVTMTNIYQDDMERWLSLAADKHDGIKEL
jgi:hypothetical protein